MTRTVNVIFALNHGPRCPFHDAPIRRQLYPVPARFRGFVVDIDDIDDRTIRVHCTCGGQAIWRDGEYVGEVLVDDDRTAFAREKIAEIEAAYPLMRRSARGARVSRAMMAKRVGIDRDTISDWTHRGWMTWPPEAKNPQV